MSIIYLACPYSHDDAEVRLDRFEAVNRVAGRLMREGEIVFSPISHSHSIAEVCDLPLDWGYWENFGRTYISIASKMYVLKLDGWRTSVGVAAEIRLAEEAGIPILFLRPGSSEVSVS